LQSAAHWYSSFGKYAFPGAVLSLERSLVSWSEKRWPVASPLGEAFWLDVEKVISVKALDAVII